MAIVSWIVFTVAIGLIKPPPHSCWREMNATHQAIERVGYATSTHASNIKILVKRQFVPGVPTIANRAKQLNRFLNASKSARRQRIKPTTTTLAPKKNLLEEDDDIDSSEEDNPINENNRVSAMNYLPINKPAQKTMGNPLSITHTNISLVKPLASHVLYETKDVRNVFMVFLLLIIVGEFFSAPAITLAVRILSTSFAFVLEENRSVDGSVSFQ